MNNSLSINQYKKITYVFKKTRYQWWINVYSYDISLYLELKRLQDFEIDDLKRYYEVIDKNIDINEELHGN